MVKFVLFLMFILLTVQKSYEVKNATNEVLSIRDESGRLYKLIENDIFKFMSFPERYETNKEFDMELAYDNLKARIFNITNNYEINKKNLAQAICCSDALLASLDAWHKHKRDVDSCSSKVEAVPTAITNDLWVLDEKAIKLHDDIKAGMTHCLNDNEDLKPKVDNKCMEELAHKSRVELDERNTEFMKSSSIMHDRADDSIVDLRKCLVEVEDFSEISNNITKTLEKCIEDNSASNIYSRSILYFCLFLFCLLRMM